MMFSPGVKICANCVGILYQQQQALISDPSFLLMQTLRGGCDNSNNLIPATCKRDVEGILGSQLGFLPNPKCYGNLRSILV